MKIKKTRIVFLSMVLVIAELLPFLFFLHYKPMEACEQNMTRTALARDMIFDHRLYVRCR